MNTKPTDQELLNMMENYANAITNLKNLGFIKLTDGGANVRITDRGKKYLGLQERVDNHIKNSSESSGSL